MSEIHMKIPPNRYERLQKAMEHCTPNWDQTKQAPFYKNRRWSFFNKDTTTGYGDSVDSTDRILFGVKVHGRKLWTSKVLYLWIPFHDFYDSTARVKQVGF